MGSPDIFYILYFQDCGYAAVGCAVVMRGVSKDEARRTYPDTVRKQGYACTAEMNPGGAEGSILRFERVPAWLAAYSDNDIHDYYNPPKPCEHMRDGRCRVDTCRSTEAPYGCYTKAQAEWKAKWEERKPKNWRDSMLTEWMRYLWRK